MPVPVGDTMMTVPFGLLPGMLVWGGGGERPE